jgi:multiple sugar transport system substrate-binding protein
MKRTFTTACAVLGVATAMLAAVPLAHAADAQTLSIWANDEPKSITIDMANEFAKLHPEVKVQIRRVGFGALNDETMRAAMAGNGPDIVTIDNPNVAMFASRGALLDLTPLLDKSKIIDTKQIYTGPLENATWDHKVYAIPREVNTLALYYSEDAFKAAGLDPDKPPQTWDELYADAQKLTDASKGVYGLAFSAIGTEEGTFQFLPFIQTADASWNAPNSPGAIRAVQFWQKLIDHKVASPDTLSRTQSEAAASFINGNAAMDIDGPWELPGISKGAKFKWRVALLPVEKAGAPRASALGGLDHAILKSSKNPALAFEFLEYMYSQQPRAWNEFGLLPPSKNAVTKDPQWPEAYKVFSQQMVYARPRGPNPNWMQFSKAIYTAMQQVLTHQADAATAMKNAQADIDKINKK